MSREARLGAYMSARPTCNPLVFGVSSIRGFRKHLIYWLEWRKKSFKLLILFVTIYMHMFLYTQRCGILFIGYKPYSYMLSSRSEPISSYPYTLELLSYTAVYRRVDHIFIDYFHLNHCYDIVGRPTRYKAIAAPIGLHHMTVSNISSNWKLTRVGLLVGLWHMACKFPMQLSSIIIIQIKSYSVCCHCSIIAIVPHHTAHITKNWNCPLYYFPT